jgi:hypothetical protein
VGVLSRERGRVGVGSKLLQVLEHLGVGLRPIQDRDLFKVRGLLLQLALDALSYLIAPLLLASLFLLALFESGM